MIGQAPSYTFRLLSSWVKPELHERAQKVARLRAAPADHPRHVPRDRIRRALVVLLSRS